MPFGGSLLLGWHCCAAGANQWSRRLQMGPRRAPVRAAVSRAGPLAVPAVDLPVPPVDPAPAGPTDRAVDPRAPTRAAAPAQAACLARFAARARAAGRVATPGVRRRINCATRRPSALARRLSACRPVCPPAALRAISCGGSRLPSLNSGPSFDELGLGVEALGHAVGEAGLEVGQDLASPSQQRAPEVNALHGIEGNCLTIRRRSMHQAS